MGYAPNVNAVEFLAYEIMPKVWEKLPNAKLYIAGAQPDPKVKKVACDNIIVSGWIDDMRDAYAQSRIFIAPMRIGTGLQNKLLEAMSMKIPCITTALANGQQLIGARRRHSVSAETSRQGGGTRRGRLQLREPRLRLGCSHKDYGRRDDHSD